jgi:hydrogenase maturation protease
MAEVLIVGVVTPLRGDDAFAWHAIQRLRERFCREHIEIFICHQLTPELAEAVVSSKRVIFIDAPVGEPPRQINLKHLVPKPPPFPVYSHTLNPLELMACASELYGRWPEAFTVSVNGQEYGYGESLSWPVQAAIPKALQLMELLLTRNSAPAVN